MGTIKTRLNMAALVFAIALTAAVVAAPSSSAGVLDDGYQRPVAAPVSDPYRAPSHRYGSGNRGIEYATRRGQTVGAAAEGVVAFVGPVAGRLIVSIDHPDGLRTSYTHLLSVSVRRGQAVGRGDTVGISTTRLHFGVRAGDAYLDPELLFSFGRRPPRLVPIRQHYSHREARSGPR